MNLLDKIILFLSAIIYHYRKKLFKKSNYLYYRDIIEFLANESVNC
jgi:hypothetical protein